MTVFTSDLDNTLIYSYKHEIGTQKRNVELYQGREISFITEKTYSLLKEVNSRCLFVPVTTRSIEQYKRIDFGIGPVKYALACNGGVLLVNSEKEPAWYKDSLELVKPCLEEIKKGIAFLENEPARFFEIRFIEDLFVFTKCHDPLVILKKLKDQLDLSLVSVFNNGEKIYILPAAMDKGLAVRRFREYIKAQRIISAGDSEFDIPLLENSDIGLIPADFVWDLYCSGNQIFRNKEDVLFSEFVLENVLKYII